MRILFHTRSYPTSAAPGVAPFTRDHALAAARHADVVVLHTERTREPLRGLWEIETETEETAVPVVRVRFNRPPVRALTPLLYHAAALRGLREVLGRPFHPDLVHGHFCEAAAATARLARRLGVPYVLTEHSSRIVERSLSPLERRAARRAFRGAARVLPVSEMLRQALESYGLDAACEVVPNAVDLDAFFPPPSRPSGPAPKLIAVTRMTPIKGVPDLLEALRLLKARRDDWSCDLIGGGERGEEYRALAVRLDLEGHVRFRGELARAEVAKALRQADLFVLASRIETFSVATVEALACGVPVVVTACGGPEELVGPESGRIVPPGDPAALAEALDRMLTERERFVDVGRGVAERFGSAAVGDRLRAVYEKVLS